MLVKVASLWPLVDNISFEAVDDSSARVTLTDHSRAATGTLFFDRQGRVTDFVALRPTLWAGRLDINMATR